MPVNRWRAGHARFPVRVTAMRGTGRGGRRANMGEAQNLSRGRVLLRLDRAMVPGVPVGVTLRLGPRPPLTLAGAVISVQPHPNLPGRALEPGRNAPAYLSD